MEFSYLRIVVLWVDNKDFFLSKSLVLVFSDIFNFALESHLN